jgi:DNA-binding PadR family transcriptional regulator
MSATAGQWGAEFPACDGWELLGRLREQVLGLQMTGKRGRGWSHSPGARFGAPPWAGPWESGWGGGPSRQRASRGDVRLAILALLAEAPRHGYQLIQDIGERSHGAWTPSPGAVYPSLSALQDEGLIDEEKVEGRRVFSLTEAGRGYVEARSEEIGAVFAGFSQEQAEEVEDLRHLMMGVGAAAMQVIAAGEAEQARQILNRARRELFAVLAADDEES